MHFALLFYVARIATILIIGCVTMNINKQSLFDLNVYEGGYEEVSLMGETICSISKTPIAYEKSDVRKIFVMMYNGDEYQCEYDLNNTIQPGMKFRFYDKAGIEIANVEYNAGFNKVINILDKKLSLQIVEYNKERLILDDEQEFAKINYKTDGLQWKYIGDCKISILQECIEKNKLYSYAALIAATRML